MGKYGLDCKILKLSYLPLSFGCRGDTLGVLIPVWAHRFPVVVQPHTTHIHKVLLLRCDSPCCPSVCALSRKVTQLTSVLLLCHGRISPGVSLGVMLYNWCVVQSVLNQSKLGVMQITTAPRGREVQLRWRGETFVAWGKGGAFESKQSLFWCCVVPHWLHAKTQS